MVKFSHPFRSTGLPNEFYFIHTHPNRYDPVDYFRTFSGIKTVDKGRLHKYWTAALRILLESPMQKFKDNGGRLQARWSLPDKGLGTFWDEIEKAESVNDILSASSENVRKRSIRSAERNILGAIDDISENINKTRKLEKERRIPASGKENEWTQSVSVDEHKASCVDAQDARVQAAEVQGVGIHEVHDGTGVQDEDDTSQVDTAADCDELLSQKSTESDCEQSRSIFYLAGNGSVDCSEALWTPWLMNKQDLAPKLWRYREAIIAKAQRLEPLMGSTEKLVVSHIYLFEKNDSISSLFAAVGAQDWVTITNSTMQQMMDGPSLIELQTLAIEISDLTHPEAEERALDWAGPRDIKKTLAGLLADDFLWSRTPFNEHELLSHIFDPFIKSFICSVNSSTGRWDKTFSPSEKRRKDLIEDSRGRRPDFFLQTALPDKMCHLFFMEGKRKRQGSVVQVDLEKLAMFMKDSIDDMQTQGVNASKIEVIGLVVTGSEGRLYTMRLESRGIYAMRLLSVVYAPRSQYDFCVLASTINTFMNVRERLRRTISDISCSQGNALDLTRPGFHTPTRVFKA